MQYRQLGKAGVRVSVIGLGTNQFGSEMLPQEKVNDVLDAAIDLGINFIDTADMYQKGRSETVLGNALKGRWDKFVVATKCFFPVGEGTNDKGVSRYHIQNAVEASLKRLQSDHIDLLYMHRWDDSVPIEETLRTLDDLVRAGKVRYIGASNYLAWQIVKSNMLAELKGWTAFAALQNHCHMLHRDDERDVLPACVEFGVGYVPFFPLAGGFLTGKYKRGEEAPAGSRGERSTYVQNYMTETNYDKVEKLTAWAEERGHQMNELAQAWLMAQSGVCSVISGATKLTHVQSNAKAADWNLTADEMSEVNAILDG